MIAVGFYSRAGAALVFASSIIILYSFFGFSNLLELNSVNGFKAELIYLYIAMSICIIFSGSGKYAIKQD